MSRNVDLSFDNTFKEYLLKAQEEVERLNLKNISSLIFLKVLIDDKESYLNEFFKDIGVKRAKAERNIKKQVKTYAKKNSNENYEILLTISNEDDEKVELFITQEMYCIIQYSINFSLTEVILDEILFVLSLLFCKNSEYLSEFFESINVNMSMVQRYYEGLLLDSSFDEVAESIDSFYDNVNNNYSGNDEELKIPFGLKNCLSCVSFENTDNPIILCRDKEISLILTILLKSKKRNVVLIGKPGVGKTAIIEHLAWLISKGKCPEELANKKILSLDVNAIVAGTTLRGQAEEKFKILVEFLESRSDVILFVDEMHTMLGAGSAGIENRSLDLSNALKPILARGNVSVIGATTEMEYQQYFSKDGAFKRRFEVVKVREPKYKDVYPMTKKQIEHLQEIHKIKIDRKIIDYVILMASCFNSQTCNPDRTLDLVDRSMAKSKMMGKKFVDKESVLNNFDANFELYNEMTKETKTTIAYHEAGHFIFNRYSEYLKHNKPIAVTIIPTDDYMGLTVTDVSDDEAYLKDYNACIDLIASMLAGRIAEKMFTKRNTTGARQDLLVATNIAKEMLVMDGLVHDFSDRNFEEDRDENSKKRLNKEIDKLISEASERAKQVLNTHQLTLERIATALLKAGILIGPELEKICNEEELKQS